MQLGVQNLYIARVNKSGDARTYDKPFKASDTIKIDLSTETIESTLYSHDELIYKEKDFKKGKVIINTADISQEVVLELLSLEKDSDGVVYSGSAKNETSVFAVGFQSAKSDGTNKYIWLLEVTFSTPNETYETMKDGMTIITPTIEGEFVCRPDGKWKADYVGLPKDKIAGSWFKEVHTYVSPETRKLITFNDLTGLIVTGVWDSATSRLTC